MKRRKLILLLLAMVLLMFSMLSGCAKKEQTAANKWGIDKFVVVQLPRDGNPELYAYWRFFEDALSEVIGIPVEEIIGTDYTACIEAMRTGHAHLADFGPLAYTFARERADAEALVNWGVWDVEAQEYNVGFYGMVIVRADSDIYTFDDLVGRSFAFTDPASTSGYLVPGHELLTYFHANGYPDLTFDELQTNGKFFSAATFSGSHQNSINSVYLGDIDAAGVANTTFESLVRRGLVEESEIRIISKSPMIPQDPYAIKGTLPQELKDLVLQFLLDFDDPRFFGGYAGAPSDKDRFLRVEDSAYDYLQELRDTYNLSE
ncbi:MAG: phosphate/phosphite/phosphonate ABC transporter substrate-binding protein [Eubacteriaceae bacterium]|nr:phosphate/phosphite/phosphonate ABC transporter substrate-binding protein [Eubacteriaceae bacterium]